MKYEHTDFLETATQDILDGIARARELTREYYNSDYKDMDKRRQFSENYWEVWVKMWRSTHRFTATMEKIFL